LRRAVTLRSAITDQDGFTLIELLVVILIIGLLAEIAIPSFLGQTSRADDAVAKSAVRTAQTAVETYRVEHGDYCGVTPAALVTIEPALSAADGLAVSGCAGGDASQYTLSVTSKSSFATVYTVSASAGAYTRTCSTPEEGGCKTGGVW
jgi:type IV pilus assembly protein PilA